MTTSFALANVRPLSTREPFVSPEPSGTRLVVVTIVLTSFAFAVHALVLFRTSAPLGLDGYYYAVQLRSLLATGRLYYPAMPFAFWLLAPFAALTNPIVGTKIGAAVFAALAVPAVILFVRSSTRDTAYAALGGLIFATSAESLMLSSEFVKQGIGLTLVLWLLVVVVRARRTSDWIVAAILFAACVCTHGTSAILAAWFVAPLILARLEGAMRAVALAGIVVSAAAVLYRYRELIDSLSRTATATTEAPIETRLAAMSIVLLCAAAYLRRAEGFAWIPLVAGPATFAIALNLPGIDGGSVSGFGPRLQLIGFVPLALCLPIALHLLARRAWIAIVVMIAIGPFSLIALREFAARRYEAPEPLSIGLTQLRGRLPENALLIAQEHSTAFASKWYTEAETVSLEPRTIDPSRTYRLLWTGIPHRIKIALSSFESLPAAAALPRSIRVNGTGHFSLIAVPEPTWRVFVATLPPDLREMVIPWPSRQSQ